MLQNNFRHIWIIDLILYIMMHRKKKKKYKKIPQEF